MKKIRKNGFTLAETLITVVILGIVAAILVPNLINRQVENANRTKVKKAMASYEKAINFIIFENDIKSTEELKEFGEEENCKFSKGYFKTVQDGNNDCIFKTADRVWWNITDLTNPILILKDSQKNKEVDELRELAKEYKDKTVFSMVGRFDDVGTLRVNDNAYEQTYGTIAQQKYVAKLWYFITQSISTLSGLDRCKLEGATTCTVTTNGNSVTYTKITTNTDTTVDKNYNGKPLCTYDRENNKSNCTTSTYISASPAGDYWISSNLGSPTEEEAKDMTGSVCTYENSHNYNCVNSGDYYEAAKRKCAQAGGHLATLAELKIAKNTGIMQPGGGFYFASEETLSYASCTMTGYGAVYLNNYHKSNSHGNVICVGN